VRVARSELAHSVELSVNAEARRNALRLAYVRIVALCATALLDAVFFFFPQQTIGVAQVSPVNAMVAGLWCAVAVGFAFGIRAGWDSAVFRGALAVIDPLIVLTLFGLIFLSVQETPKMMHPVTVSAAGFTLIAVSGALRLSRSAAAGSGLLSIAGFGVVAAMAGYTLAEGLFVCAIIACAGLLGARLADNTRRAAAAEGRRVILRRFLPVRLAEGDPQETLALIAHPRNVDATILVTDLRGFTAQVEHLSPEAALGFLNEIQGALAACVHRCGGSVDKFMGDGMLAVFGVIEPLEHHAVAAIQAATEMREIVSTTRLKIGIGIHSGAVVAGCIGDGERLEFTVIGDTVNTASRLEGVTKELQADIVVSDATLSRLDSAARKAWHFRDCGERELRGRAMPVRVHTIEPELAAGRA
jgi:class 3 adenylate cyclase